MIARLFILLPSEADFYTKRIYLSKYIHCSIKVCQWQSECGFWSSSSFLLLCHIHLKTHLFAEIANVLQHSVRFCYQSKIVCKMEIVELASIDTQFIVLLHSVENLLH